MKGRIVTVGIAYRHESDERGFTSTVRGWHFVDGPGTDIAAGTFSGYMVDELCDIYERSIAAGTWPSLPDEGRVR